MVASIAQITRRPVVVTGMSAPGRSSSRVNVRPIARGTLKVANTSAVVMSMNARRVASPSEMPTSVELCAVSAANTYVRERRSEKLS